MKKIILKLFMAMMLFSSSLNYAQKPLRLIELVTLNTNYKLNDHIKYGQKIEYILNRNGMENVANFKILKKASGTVASDAVKVGVFELESPENLKQIFGDKEYNEKYVPERNKIHNMERMTFFMAKPIIEKPYDKSKTVIVDFVVLNNGYTEKDRDKYFKKLTSKYGKKHGLKRFASYEVIKFMRGVAPKGTTMINFYEVNDDTLKNLTSDKKYIKKMIPIRNKIFNMNELSVLVVQPIKK